LQSAEQIMERVVFQNTGPDQVPGVIVMTISDLGDDSLDPAHRMIAVVFNASPETVSVQSVEVAGLPLELHPVQAASADPVVREAAFDLDSATFSVPGLTTAVFVLAQ
jgi:hypothetical protein